MKKIVFGFAVIIAVTAFTPTAQAQQAHSPGSAVVDSKGTIYQILSTQDVYKAPYPDANAFLSYKFNSWSKVQTANSADLAIADYPSISQNTGFMAPRPGSLINDKGTIYLVVQQNGRAGFTSDGVFRGMGYSYDNVYAGDSSYLVTQTPISTIGQAHPAGTLVNDNGTLYINAYGFKLGIPSIKVLESWGYWLNDAVPANSYDKALKMVDVVKERESHQLFFFYAYQEQYYQQ